MAKAALEVRLLDAEWAWLTESAAARSLPDEGKAFRCCVNYLAQTGATVECAGSEALAAGAIRPQLGTRNSQRTHGIHARHRFSSTACGYNRTAVIRAASGQAIPI